MMKPRYYQVEAVEAILKELESKRSTMIVKATGCGKTVTIGNLIDRWRDRPGRVLVLAHRDELIQQASKTIKAMNEDDQVEVEHGGSGMRATRTAHRNDSMWGGIGRIVVASKDTLWRNIPDVDVEETKRQGQHVYKPSTSRMPPFERDEFSLIITDECHHATATTYRVIYDYFASAKHVGVTATADRTDGQALGQVFESVAYIYDILQAVSDGFLVRPVQQYVTVQDYDLSGIKINRKSGDFDDDDLDKFLRQEKILAGMVVPMMELANSGGQRRPVLGFANSVGQAKDLAQVINNKQPGSAAHICCMSTDLDTRRYILQQYRAGEIQYLMNYGILTEGTDLPDTRCIFMARPTKSRLLYTQMAGRGLRPHSSITDLLNEAADAAARQAIIAASTKPSCLIIDMVGVTGTHKLICSMADALAGWYNDDIVSIAKNKAAARAGRGDVFKDLEEAKQEFDQLAKQQQEKRRVKVNIGVQYSTRDIDPFDPSDTQRMQEPKWATGKQATEGQLNFLRTLGLGEQDLPKGFWDAKTQIDKLVNRRKQGLCSYRQGKTLRKFGYDPEAIKFAEAGKLIDDIAKNGWKRV